MTKTPVLYK